MDARIKSLLSELEVATDGKAKRIKLELAKAINEAVAAASGTMPMNGWIALAVAAALALCAGYAMGRV